jgi:hypothetical protein
MSENPVHSFLHPSWNVHTRVGFHSDDGRRVARSKVNIFSAKPSEAERKSFLSQMSAKLEKGDPLSEWKDEVRYAVEDAFENPGEWTPWIATQPPPLPL